VYAEIEIRQLRCVIAVADELHFTRAHGVIFSFPEEEWESLKGLFSEVLAEPNLQSVLAEAGLRASCSLLTGRFRRREGRLS
jgi:hypothetical protein